MWFKAKAFGAFLEAKLLLQRMSWQTYLQHAEERHKG